MSAAEVWAEALAAWALPEHVMASAQESPWIHPPEMFTLPSVIDLTPSHERAREAMPEAGSVLDVGCGGGVAAFALVPPAAHVIGVDHQGAMLEMFAASAAERHVTCQTIEGLWPAVADQAPVADVVTCHHVVYNVAHIVPFLGALASHARHRVVIEMPDRHPLSAMNAAWEHFWQLERPSTPTPEDLLGVLEEMGINATRERFRASPRTELDSERATHFLRIRLCLPASREAEVRDYLAAQPAPGPRELSTIFFDV